MLQILSHPFVVSVLFTKSAPSNKHKLFCFIRIITTTLVELGLLFGILVSVWFSTGNKLRISAIASVIAVDDG